MVLSTGKKAMLASLFIVAVACFLIGIASVSDESSAFATEDGSEYTPNYPNAKLTSAAVVENFTIPATVTSNGNEYTVNDIDASAFAGNTTVRTITIDSGFSGKIPAGLFKDCTNLEEIIVEDGSANYVSENGALVALQHPSFNNRRTVLAYPAKGSVNVTIPENAVYIANYAYYNVAITSLTIPSSVLQIYDYASAGII